jgi:Tfp pilus assembly protein PilX
MKASMRRQTGGASLLTTVILAILLLGVVGGLATLSINEIRQAANTEQSARALSAAESGVAQLAEKIDTEVGSHERTACNSEPSTPTTAGPPIEFGENSAITCATVKAGDSEETVGVVDRDQSYRIDLSGAYKKNDSSKTPATVTAMSIEWHGTGDVAAAVLSGITFPKLTTTGNLDSPATLELTYAHWSLSGSNILALSQPEDYGIGLKKVVFNPAFNGPGVPLNRCGANASAITDGYACTTLQSATADVMDPPSRRFDLNTLSVPTTPDAKLVFKLTARYNGTHFRLKFYNNTEVLMVPQAYATIDVTARSNNLYRRVIAQKPLALTSSIDYLDNTIFSGKNICKDMKVDAGYGPAKYQNGTVIDSVNGGKNSPTCEN